MKRWHRVMAASQRPNLLINSEDPGALVELVVQQLPGKTAKDVMLQGYEKALGRFCF